MMDRQDNRIFFYTIELNKAAILLSPVNPGSVNVYINYPVIIFDASEAVLAAVEL